MNQSHKCCTTCLALPHRRFFFLLYPNGSSAPQSHPAKTSTPEDFIRMTKGITMATARPLPLGTPVARRMSSPTANLVAVLLQICSGLAR